MLLTISIIFSLYSTITLLCKNTSEIPFLYYTTGIAQLQEHLEHMFSLYPVPLQSDFYKNNVTFCHIVNLINTAKNYKIFFVFGSE